MAHSCAALVRFWGWSWWPDRRGVVADHGTGVARPSAAACTRVTNVEAIIDDSGSMAVTDSNRLRVQAMDLLINALDAKTTSAPSSSASSFDPAIRPRTSSSRPSRSARTRQR